MCTLALLSQSRRQLSLAAAAHAHQNRASLCWVGDERVQLLLLSTLDETVSRYHVWSATEVDALGTGWPAQLFDCCC